MIEHTYQVLEYYRLLDILSRYATCPLGQSNCLSLKPSNDAEFIDNELRLVSETRLLLKVKGLSSLSDISDIAPILKKASAQGSCLEPDELLRILGLSRACQQSKIFIKSNSSLCPRLHRMMQDMPNCEDLAKRLGETIALNGEIKDSASPGLKKTRQRMIRQRLNLQKNLEHIQRAADPSGNKHDHLITIRDGRYVISLRTDQKTLIPGIIHDYSKTGSTCFLEPMEVIQDNNRMAELTQEEKREEFRILTGLTRMVRDLSDDLEYSQSFISRLDGLYARARFSEALSCVMPEIGEKYDVKLKAARNPILLAMASNKHDDEEVDKPVPVDILMDGNQNLLVISGPNRGGKTVTLKTLGLMSLMVQSGIHIPVEEGSFLPVFDQIMADIGDDQDIQTGLSTFSAHAAHLRYLIEHVNEKSLVIIDEPGMGTDPDEGVALAMAVLDFLYKEGAFVAVSTHLNRLKTYGLLNPRAVNASVEFDTARNRPTFRLKYGSCGISHALEIARDIGVPVTILERARGYLDHDQVHLNSVIEKLNRLMSETSREKMEAEEVKREYHGAAREMRERLNKLEIEKRALMETKKVEASQAISKAREEFKKAINLLKMKKEPVQAYATERYAEVGRELMNHLEQETNDKTQADLGEWEEGQKVYHKKLKQEGIVQSIDSASGRIMLMLGKVKVSAGIEDLQTVDKVSEFNPNEMTKQVSWHLEDSPLKELNVIGYRVDDAIPLIDKTIDRALIDGQLSLRIIHGFGTGKLREAIRAHLKETPSVNKVYSADAKSGGDAITIVEF